MDNNQRMKQINLTPQDLAANKQEQLSPRQSAILRRQRLVWIGGTAAILLIILGFTAVLILKAFNPAFANQGQLVIALALGPFWLWLLRHNPAQWRQVNRDIRDGRIAHLTGKAEPTLGMGIGLFRTLQYHLHINDQSFRVSPEIYRQFEPGQTYRVYHSPGAKVFLGALTVVQPVEKIGVGSTAVKPLLDPLTEREVEILQLIAAGLSNKEIAAQLSLSTNTVKMYASQLYQKLDVSRRTEAVARARDIGLLDN
jgi:DNA-binding CsgD family transcriptional regulator